MTSSPAEVLPDAPPAAHESASEFGDDSEEDEYEIAPSVRVKPEPAASSPPPDVAAIFDDGDDDEDYGDADDADLIALESLALPAQPTTTTTTTTAAAADISDPQTMHAFYQRLFPWRLLFQWLNHSPIPTHDFSNREFAFTLQNDAYLRYQSFPNFETLRKDVLRLNPSRFEIGPVYTANPRDRKSLRKSAFKPISKELVFDIDLTDYDDIRTCCDKANICHKCWQFITVAIKIMDAALRDDFGFKHIMWVYSGRRGAHAWVCDKRARVMEDPKRKAIISYMEVIKGGDKSGKKVNLWRPLHPHLSRSMDVLRESFAQNVLRDQDPWRENERAERLLELLPDKTLASELRRKWESHPNRSSFDKWADIDNLASSGASKSLDAAKLRDAKHDIVFEYQYPRLDAEVSKHLNHLLKSPFVVHPGTGRVCVPIDAERPEDFDPLGVPTVTELLREIDEWNKNKGVKSENDAEEKATPDYEKTSLKPYVEYFRRFVAGILKEEMGEVKVKRERGGDSMEF